MQQVRLCMGVIGEVGVARLFAHARVLQRESGGIRCSSLKPKMRVHRRVSVRAHDKCANQADDDCHRMKT